MFFNPSFSLESLRGLHLCPPPSSLNWLDFLEVERRYSIYFKISDSFIYKQGDTFYVWAKCFDRAADFGKEFLSGTESGLNSMTYNNSLTQDLLIHCQGYDYDPEGQYVCLFQENS